MTNQRKLLHIVGGGVGQLPLVSKAREMGLRVLVTDMYEDPPCRSAADHFVRINTVDMESTLAAARQYGIDAITTDQTDVAMPTVAYVAERLSLPGIGYETALRFSNKRIMREGLAGICPENVPGFRSFASREECTAYIRGQKGRLIVKPTDSQGSRGVHPIPNNDAPEHLAEDAFSNSRSGQVFVETFVQGYEIAVETVVVDREPHLLAVSRKDHYPENDAIDMRVNFPAGLSEELERKVRELNSRIVKGLGLPFGLTHAEYKVDDERVWIMEIAARGAGSGVSGYIVPFLTGFDTCSALVGFAFGAKPEISIADYRARRAVLEFLPFCHGRVRRISIAPEVCDISLSLGINVQVGDVIGSILDSRYRPGFFIVGAENDLDLQEKTARVREMIAVECE